MKHLLRLVPFLLAPGLASASVVWKADFESGDLSQWDRKQVVATDRLQVQSDIVRDGRYALKATVHQGDDPINGSGNRNEVLHMSLEPTGSEYYYKWSSYFPASYPRAATWQVFTQWHQMGEGGSPPLEFFINDDVMHMRAGGETGPVLWNQPLVRDTWHDFVLHVKWSSNPKVGFVELWYDGQLVVQKTNVPTQFGSDVNYLKQGLYRNDTIAPVGTVYHDGFTIATTLEDVMPPAQPAPEPVATPTPEQPSTDTSAPAGTGSSTDTGTPSTPVATTPVSYTPPQGSAMLPGDAQSPDTMGGKGCGASATGGMPVVAAASLLGGFLVRRRRARAAKRQS